MPVLPPLGDHGHLLVRVHGRENYPLLGRPVEQRGRQPAQRHVGRPEGKLDRADQTILQIPSASPLSLLARW